MLQDNLSSTLKKKYLILSLVKYIYQGFGEPITFDPEYCLFGCFEFSILVSAKTL